MKTNHLMRSPARTSALMVTKPATQSMKISKFHLTIFKHRLLIQGPTHYLKLFSDRDFRRMYVAKGVIESIFVSLITEKELYTFFHYIVTLLATRGTRAIIENLSRYQPDIEGYLKRSDESTWLELLRKLPKCMSRLKSLKRIREMPCREDKVNVIRLLLTLCLVKRLFVVD